MSEVILVTAAVIIHDRRVLLAQRRLGDHLGGMWEFPGGKICAGESPPLALKRELAEELGIEAEVLSPYRFVYWEYPEKRVLILFYRCTITGGDPRPLECAAIGWYGAADLAGLPMLPADEGVVKELVTSDLQPPAAGRQTG